jgi:hypothetical protein
MQTKVIHIKNKTGAPEEVYIGRGSVFGNPIRIGYRCPLCGEKHDRGQTLVCYRKWLDDMMEADIDFTAEVYALHGKTLVCFCKPLACHGDILAEVTDAMHA